MSPLRHSSRQFAVGSRSARAGGGWGASERGESIRVLSAGSAPTMADAARELGMSRATLYRKVSQCGIRLHA